MNNYQKVVDLMRSSSSEKEWNENCDKVKAENGNDYPEFWFRAIIMSGLHNDVVKKWK
jgi:hypothetical protein